ncbi:MAG: hypothetical protein B6226_05305, partial [Candidatus Cloacimonetes bacterium 4572_65]
KVLLFILRTLSVLIVLVYLFLPIFRRVSTSFEKPKGIILIDNSESMNNKVGEKSKKEISESSYNSLIKSIENSYRTSEYSFASGISGSKKSTDIVKTVKELFSNEDFTGAELFLFSDGYYVNNDFSQLSNYPVTINTFEHKNNSSLSQAKIINVRNSRTSFIDEKVPFEITIEKSLEDTLTLIALNKGRIFYKETIPISDKSVIKKMIINKFKKRGLQEITLQLKSRDEVLDSRKVVVNIEDNKGEIAFLTDSPNWDLKFIKDIVKLDKKFKQKVLVQRKGSIYINQDKVKLAEELEGVSLLVIINNGRIHLSQKERETIKKRVKQGVSLFLVGAPTRGIEELYPVTKSNVTREYETSVIPGFSINDFVTFKDYFKDYQELTPVRYNFYSLKSGAKEIATFDNLEKAPAISYSRLNEARILHFAFHDFWQWKMRTDSAKFTELITNIINWLNSKAGESFLFSTDKDGFYFGENITFRSVILDEKGDYLSGKDLHLEIKDSTGVAVIDDYLVKVQEEYLYEADFLSPGKYQAILTDIDTKQKKQLAFLVLDDNLEKQQDDFNNQALFQLAEETGGQMYSLNNIEQLKGSLKRDKLKKEEVLEYDLVRNISILILFIILFSLELFLRKRWGLL